MTEPGSLSKYPRLDHLLVERGLFATRSRARDAVVRGAVSIDGIVAVKPGQPASPTAAITINDPARGYVSRAALKLELALDFFAVDVSGREALDIGASTGGFTQILLQRGAAHVTAIDVGHGQLDDSLADDPRLTSIEGLNARDLMDEDLDGRIPGVIVADVSFISLKQALPPALEMASSGAHCVLLVKPQFEAGRRAIGKGGILRDPADGPRVAEDLRQWLDGMPGWRALGLTPSPIDGQDGNQEFLLAGIKDRP